MTRRLALIGSPLRRPHSAVMHNAALGHFGIDARYELVELDATALDRFFTEARSEDWIGFQVTAPYKRAAMARCDVVESTARRIGAVNSVVRTDDGSLVGFNTDAPGFARSAERDLAVTFRSATVAVAGAGGAARAVVAACLDAGADRVVVGARNLDAANALAADLAGDEQRILPVDLHREFDVWLRVADLAVNATTVGMTSPGMAFDPGEMSEGAAVFDLVYVPSVTPLLSRASDHGLRATNGLGMLIAQAEIAFDRWTGHPDAGPVMLDALVTDGLIKRG